MIRTYGITKDFGNKRGLDHVDLQVDKGSIYGLVGTNGSGKTTLLKHIAGVYAPTEGTVTIDEQPSFENDELKQRVCFIPDELYFFGNYSLSRMRALYSKMYDNWNDERFDTLVSAFKLDTRQKLTRFSKGMQKQAAFALAISAMPDYLILDEPVDGLDPIVRHTVWNYILNDAANRNMSALISSHNLKEIEGICDTVGILDKGKLVIQRNLDDLKSSVHKVQIALKPSRHSSKLEQADKADGVIQTGTAASTAAEAAETPTAAESPKAADAAEVPASAKAAEAPTAAETPKAADAAEASANAKAAEALTTAKAAEVPASAKAAAPAQDPYASLKVLHRNSVGSVDMLIVSASEEEIYDALAPLEPVILEILPLTLEETFIYELGGLDNEYADIIK